MVLVKGTIKRDDGSDMRVKEEFKTEAEAKRFKKFLGRGAAVKIIRHKKKATTGQGYGMRAIKLTGVKFAKPRFFA